MIKRIFILLCSLLTVIVFSGCNEVFYSTPVIQLDKSEYTKVTMPDLSGKTVKEANENALTYKLNTIEKFSADIPAGQIFEQSVPAGDEVSPGAVIDVYVSKGAKYSEIPYVSDFNYQVAKTVLESVGFEVKIVYEGKKGSCDDSINSISPEQGKSVIYGSQITIRANALEPVKRTTVSTTPIARNGTLPVTSKTTY